MERLERPRETLLTWVKESIHAHLPGPHETADLLHVPSPHDVLEHNVVGEVNSPPRRRHRDRGGWGLLCRRPPRCAGVARGFAVRGDIRGRCPVRRRGLVRGRGGRGVVRRGVVRRAVLRRRVLGCRGVRRRVLRGLVKWRGVVGGRVVRRRVLWGARVRRHGHAVVVLHPCVRPRRPPRFADKSRRRQTTIPKRNGPDPTDKWYPPPSPTELDLYPRNFQVEYLLSLAKNYDTYPILCIPSFLFFLWFFFLVFFRSLWPLFSSPT